MAGRTSGSIGAALTWISGPDSVSVSQDSEASPTGWVFLLQGCRALVGPGHDGAGAVLDIRRKLPPWARRRRESSTRNSLLLLTPVAPWIGPLIVPSPRSSHGG